MQYVAVDTRRTTRRATTVGHVGTLALVLARWYCVALGLSRWDSRIVVVVVTRPHIRQFIGELYYTLALVHSCSTT